MARPVLALLTDFGHQDHYVGVMKGVMLGICPDATLVDVTHEIPPHDIRAGAYELAVSYRYFPRGTVFVAVVDPGVGSLRQAIAVETPEHRFVAPDNGLLTPVIENAASWRAVALAEARFALPEISRTFEGRDRFAPAAAWLASGVPLDQFGPSIDRLVELSRYAPELTPDGLHGAVIRIDRFGNLITNLDRAAVAAFGPGGVVDAADHTELPIVGTYADVAPGTLCALFGSSERLELSVSGASAAAMTGLGAGAPVRVRRGA